MTSDQPITQQREQILANAVYVTEEAARLIRVEPSTIRSLVRCGRLNAQGRPFRILGAELLRFVGGQGKAMS